MAGYKRILLKLSGEALAGTATFGIDADRVRTLAREVADVAAAGIQVGVVVGGGNIFRGVAAAARNMDRVTGDHMGMLATVINSLALSDALEQMGIPTRVMSAIEMHQVAEPYIRRRAIRHLEKGRVVIFGAGTGNPFFTTDTGAALRAAEIDAQAVLKGTKMDGVFDCDPRTNPGAVLLPRLSYTDVITRQELGVMDTTAITLCAENEIPVVVFNMHVTGNIERAMRGDVDVGTRVGHDAAWATKLVEGKEAEVAHY